MIFSGRAIALLSDTELTKNPKRPTINLIQPECRFKFFSKSIHPALEQELYGVQGRHKFQKEHSHRILLLKTR